MESQEISILERLTEEELMDVANALEGQGFEVEDYEYFVSGTQSAIYIYGSLDDLTDAVFFVLDLGVEAEIGLPF